MSKQPLSKRQKRGGGDEKEATTEIIAFGGPMYDEATAHKILKEVLLVREYEEIGEEAVVGFDPDDVDLDICPIKSKITKVNFYTSVENELPAVIILHAISVISCPTSL